MKVKFCAICNKRIVKGQCSRARKKKLGGGLVHSDCFWDNNRKHRLAKLENVKARPKERPTGDIRLRLAEYAEKMRHAPTPSERRMEERLREYGKHRGWIVISQQPFMSWIFDFYLERMGVFIEVDGSAHDTPEQKRKDKRKQLEAEKKGFSVVRVRNKEVANFDLSIIPANIDDGEEAHEWLEAWLSGKKKPKDVKTGEPRKARLIKKAA